MMILRIIILAAAIFILGCSVLSNTDAPEQAPEIKEVKNAGVSFIYSTNDFAEVKIKKEQKLTAQDIGKCQVKSVQSHVS